MTNRHEMPWLGTCPHCGKPAVFREDGDCVIGACCGGGPCWWAGEMDKSGISTARALGTPDRSTSESVE